MERVVGGLELIKEKFPHSDIVIEKDTFPKATMEIASLAHEMDYMGKLFERAPSYPFSDYSSF